MKTSELIKQLRDIDPNDECDVCIGNHPIRYVDRMPWWYDGRKETVVRDPETNRPILAGYIGGNNKIKLIEDSIEEALLANPDVELDLSGITNGSKIYPHYQKNIDHWIEEGRKYQAWDKAVKEARDNGLPIPFPDERTWKQKLAGVLRRIGLIDYES
jgi:hypothetical protein